MSDDKYQRWIELAHVLREVGHERQRQDEEWGIQNHHPVLWHLILAEEFGEVGKALNEWHFRHDSILKTREELVQVAAVAVAMIESIDRNFSRDERGTK